MDPMSDFLELFTAQLNEKPAKTTEGLTPSTPAGDLNLINASKLSALRKKKQSLNKLYDEMAYNLGSTQKLRTLDEPTSPLKNKGPNYKGNLVDSPEVEEEFAVSSAELVKLKEASKFTKAIAKLDKQMEPSASGVYKRIEKNMKNG
jgi:hypothetical protein